MAAEAVLANLKNLITDIGRAAVSSAYPDEIEYYACALELVDLNDRTIDYLLFPVMPESISISRTMSTNVRKTSGGVLILNNPTFIPFEIRIAGNFGRKFRFMLGQKDVLSSALSLSSAVESMTANVLSSQIKTGYGVCKLLEGMIQKVKGDKILDFTPPYRLYFYNLAFNSNYMVEPMDYTFSQSMDRNMIWNYSLNLQAVAPAKMVSNHAEETLKKSTQFSVMNKAINGLLTSVVSLITTTGDPLNFSPKK